jgi:hypothetical protein
MSVQEMDAGTVDDQRHLAKEAAPRRHDAVLKILISAERLTSGSAQAIRGRMQGSHFRGV